MSTVRERAARPSQESSSETELDREPPIKELKTLSPEITVTSEDKRSSFVLRAKETQLEVENGIKSGVMRQVSGEMIRDGKTASTYEAPLGSIDRERQALVLKGGVQVTGEEQKLVMKADTLIYDQGKGRIEAEGHVTVTSSTMVLGPLPRLWATPDLRKIATPGKFK